MDFKTEQQMETFEKTGCTASSSSDARRYRNAFDLTPEPEARSAPQTRRRMNERAAAGACYLLISGLLLAPSISAGAAWGTFDATAQCSGAPTDNCGGSFGELSGRTAATDTTIASYCGSWQQPNAVPRAGVRGEILPAVYTSSTTNPKDPWCKAPGVTCVDLPTDTLLTAWKSTSAVWSPLEDRIILPCIAQGRIFSYDVTTGASEVLPRTPEEKPVIVRRHLDDLIIEHGEGLLVVYSRDLASRAEINLLKASNEAWSIGAVRDWYFRDDEVFAFADIAPPECVTPGAPQSCGEAWKFALIRIEVGPPLTFCPLLITEIDTLARQYTLLANSYIAEVEGVIYALMPGDPSTVVTIVNGEVASETAIEASISTAFDLTGQNKADVKALFSYARGELLKSATASTVFPSRFFGWNGRLYLLYETGQGSGEAPTPSFWRLARLDPTRSFRIMESPLELPASSSRILLVPGRCNWAILEHRDDPQAAAGSAQIPSLLKLWQFQYAEYSQ